MLVGVRADPSGTTSDILVLDTTDPPSSSATAGFRVLFANTGIFNQQIAPLSSSTLFSIGNPGGDINSLVTQRYNSASGARSTTTPSNVVFAGGMDSAALAAITSANAQTSQNISNLSVIVAGQRMITVAPSSLNTTDSTGKQLTPAAVPNGPNVDGNNAVICGGGTGCNGAPFLAFVDQVTGLHLRITTVANAATGAVANTFTPTFVGFPFGATPPPNIAVKGVALAAASARPAVVVALEPFSPLGARFLAALDCSAHTITNLLRLPDNVNSIARIAVGA